MLVLSRGRNDKVVFPTLGISVEILRLPATKCGSASTRRTKFPFTGMKCPSEWKPTAKSNR